MKTFQIRCVVCIFIASLLLLCPSSGFSQPWRLNFKPGEKIPLERVQPERIPFHGTFWSMQRTHFPPWPGYPLFLLEVKAEVPVYVLDAKRGIFLMDDTAVDYDAIYKEREAKRQEERALRYVARELGLLSKEELAFIEEESSGGMALRSFTATELWLEITRNTNSNLVNLTLHNTRSNLFYQIHSTLGLEKPDWIPGQIFTNTVGLSNITFSPVAITNSPKKFFRAVASDTLLTIARFHDGFEASVTNNLPSELGEFKLSRITLSGDISQTIEIPIIISGTASNGVDYLDIFTFPLVGLTNSQFIDANQVAQFIELEPQEDDFSELDETVTIRIAVTNTYVIDPAHFEATITISDPPEKLFVPVTFFDTGPPIGIDYYSPSNWLVVSFGDSSIFGFVRIDTNGFKTNWTSTAGLPQEVKIGIAPTSANGFTNGTVFFGNGTQVGAISANGNTTNLTWATLTNSAGVNGDFLHGSFYVDRSGSFGGKLIVVSGGNDGDQGGGVWSVSAAGVSSPIAIIPDTHLEGLITLTNDPAKWGPWAGKILAGAESAEPPAIFSISTNGIVVTNHLDIQPEDIDLIVPNQNLYCLAVNTLVLLKLPSNLLTNFVGDLLITQEGAKDQTLALIPNNHPPRLTVVHWDGTNFVKRASITMRPVDWFEQVTFAPMDIPRF